VGKRGVANPDTRSAAPAVATVR